MILLLHFSRMPRTSFDASTRGRSQADQINAVSSKPTGRRSRLLVSGRGLQVRCGRGPSGMLAHII